jgi:hypothetical protein
MMIMRQLLLSEQTLLMTMGRDIVRRQHIRGQVLLKMSDSDRNQAQINTVVVQQKESGPGDGFEPTTSATATSQERQLLK